MSMELQAIDTSIVRHHEEPISEERVLVDDAGAAPAVDVDAVLRRLRRGAMRLGAATADDRAERIRRLLAVIRENESSIQAALAADLDRAPLDATSELLLVRSEAVFARKHIETWMAPRPVGTTLMSRGTRAYVQAQSKGVVLIVAPWNAPFACSLVPMISALAAGNAVCLKPSELAPASAAVLSRLLRATFDSTEVVAVEGDAEVARALCRAPFDHIYFTGSSAVGREVLAAAAPNLTPVTLELGGKNPVIVDETADIEDAAPKIVWGRLANAGQACVAPDHVFVHASHEERFVDALVAAVRRQCDPDRLGVHAGSGPGRIVNRRHFERVRALLDDAIAKGARVEIGGQVDEARLTIAPTILTGVDDSMAVMREEIFGPLLPVVTWTDRVELLRGLAARPTPLSLYVFSRDEAAVERWLAETRAGNSAVNHVLIQAGVNTHLPFGGAGESGTGRAVGQAGFDGFSHLRSVVHQPLGWRDFSWMSLPPVSDAYRRMVRFLFHSDA